MAKRVLDPIQSFNLRQALHIAVLDALIQSRRWEPGEIAFQGGTCLHLVYGSPRYSEDLDFMVSSALKLQGLQEAMAKRLTHSAWAPADMKITFSKDKNERNPHCFNVTLSGAGVIGAVKVKVELWHCSPTALQSLSLTVQPVRSQAWSNVGGGQVFLPTLEEREIYADKVFALGARPYLKARDIFDLDWLFKNAPALKLEPRDIINRLAIYPGADPAQWLEDAATRLGDLPNHAQAIRQDLHKWLPSTIRIQDAALEQMITSSQSALREGIEIMTDILAGDSHQLVSPRERGVAAR